MSTRYRGNFLYGTLSGFNASQTTFTGTGFPNNLTTGTYLPIVINPGYNGVTASGEIVYVSNISTSGGINTITISGGRGLEGTTAGSGSTGTQWIAGPLASDFGIANQIKNNDFPASTTSGQILTSTTTSGVAWSSSLTPSQFAAGSDGQLLVTSGTTSVWSGVRVWNNTNAGPVYNSHTGVGSPTYNPVISQTVSGCSTYIISARSGVNIASGPVAIQIGLTIASGTSGFFAYNTNTDASSDINDIREWSIQYAIQPGSRAPITYSMYVTPVTGPHGTTATWSSISIVGIG